MNLVDIYVQEVLSEPVKDPWGYTLKLRVNSHGHVYETEYYTKTLEQAQAIKPGFVYQG